MSDIGLAIIMLEKVALRSPRTLCESLRTAFPEEEVAVEESGKEKQGIYSFRLGVTTCFVSLMPAPVPWKDLESLAQAAWHWKGADAALRAHRAHLIVTFLNGPSDSLDANLLLTRIIAAILDVQQAVGVLWGGPAISSRDMFREVGKDASRTGPLPVLCWISFNLIKQGQGHFAIVTQGLERFGQQELQLLGDSSTQGAVEWSLDLVTYLLKKGPIVKPGQTFGRTADEKFLVSSDRWLLDPTKRALTVNMRPTSDRPGGFFRRLRGT